MFVSLMKIPSYTTIFRLQKFNEIQFANNYERIIKFYGRRKKFKYICSMFHKLYIHFLRGTSRGSFRKGSKATK